MASVNIETIAKYAGFATVAIEWSALLIYYLEMPIYFGSKYPISHFATLPETRFTFTVCYVFAALSFWIFTKHHLSKYYQTPLRIFAVCLLLFAGVGIFPYDALDPLSTAVHLALVVLSGSLFLVGMYLIAIRSDDQVLFRVTMISIFTSLALTAAFIFSPRDSHWIFTFEVGSWLVLQLWTIWISLHIRKRDQAIQAA